MQTIKQEYYAEITVKNSQFLAYAYPFEKKSDLDNLLLNLKKIHPKARHYCYSYRLGVSASDFRIFDDGEPSGTAGMPIYQQLLSFDASDILLVVVRYFGGTLLGAGGLVKAYKDASRAVLKLAEWQELEAQNIVQIECDYAQLNHVYYQQNAFEALLIEQDLNLNCVLKIQIKTKNCSAFLQKLQQLGINAKLLA